MGNLPLPLPRNTGTNLCLHPGHGHPLTLPPPSTGTLPPRPPRVQLLGQSSSSCSLTLLPTQPVQEKAREDREGVGRDRLSPPLPSPPPLRPSGLEMELRLGTEVALCTLSLEDGRA